MFEKKPTTISPEQQKTWDAYYEPRNAKFRAANLSGKALVSWRYQRYMHDYLATVKAVDENVGRVLDYLEREGLAENTLVVFSSDNGGERWSRNTPLGTTGYYGGQSYDFLVSTSFHILTTDGIEGRDVLGAEG